MTTLSEQVKALEIKAEKSKALAGELIAMIHVNRLYETIKCADPASEKSFDEIMEAFRKRLNDL
jgi:hypothetical protein